MTQKPATRKARELQSGDEFWTEARFTDEWGPGRAGVVTRKTSKRVYFTVRSGAFEIEDWVESSASVVKKES